MSIEPINPNPDTSVPLAYATPGAAAGSPTRAAAVVGFLGLGLIVLGGCFLIPVSEPLFDNQMGHSRLGGWQIAIMALLILIAIVCFGFAALLLFLSVRRLLAVMRG